MYDIYAYVIFIFLENDIMEVTDLERIILEKDSINIASSIFKKVYKMNLNKNQKFKQELAEFNNIKQNKELFKWVFNQDENEEKGENNA
jgi:acyl-[acyl carrier protein]--UDP-N-acetylglucosamine O-acyltransferase